jgi:hypothetical protein
VNQISPSSPELTTKELLIGSLSVSSSIVGTPLSSTTELFTPDITFPHRESVFSFYSGENSKIYGFDDYNRSSNDLLPLSTTCLQYSFILFFFF